MTYDEAINFYRGRLAAIGKTLNVFGKTFVVKDHGQEVFRGGIDGLAAWIIQHEKQE